MGFCSSYLEVQRFQENAAASVATDVLAGDIDISNTALLFVADNVDHNIITLDGKGTFHGMRMIASITPGRQTSHTILRQKIKQLKIVDLIQVGVKEYWFAKYARRNVKFQPLPLFNENDHRIDVL